jgi:uncharacterized protein with HEPN domain
MKPIRDYLADMLDYIGYLETFVAEGRTAFDHDIKTQLAARKAFEVLGEIAKRLPDDLFAQQPHTLERPQRFSRCLNPPVR